MRVSVVLADIIDPVSYTHLDVYKRQLKHMRWTLLRRGSRVRGRARQKLQALLVSKLATARAWDLKETFQHLWHYRSPVSYTHLDVYKRQE